MRERTKNYIDVYLYQRDFKRLKKGYAITKHYGDVHLSIKNMLRDRKAQREIEKLKAKLRKLETQQKKRQIPRVEAKQPEYLSVTQFANSCMITPQAVRKMITENRLEAVKMGEQYMIPYQELTRYLSIKEGKDGV